MKLRVLKKQDGNFVPQYYDEESIFPGWNECRLDNTLASYLYHSEESAIEVCEKFAEKWKNEHGEVVWTKEL